MPNKITQSVMQMLTQQHGALPAQFFQGFGFLPCYLLVFNN